MPYTEIERKNALQKFMKNLLADLGDGRKPLSMRGLETDTRIPYPTINSWSKGNVDPNRIDDANIKKLAKLAGLSEQELRAKLRGEVYNPAVLSYEEIKRNVEALPVNEQYDMLEWLLKALRESHLTGQPIEVRSHPNRRLIKALSDRQSLLNMEEGTWKAFLTQLGVSAELQLKIESGERLRIGQLGGISAALGITVDEVLELLDEVKES